MNFVIDEFINPRLRAAGLTGRQRRSLGLPRRIRLGLTPVLRPAIAKNISPSPAKLVDQ
jgi:hypothetical protein